MMRTHFRSSTSLLLALLACLGTRELPALTRGFERLLDSVVRIDVREANYDGGARRLSRGVGSGVIVTGEGHVLTNAHVVTTDAVEISVTLANLERVDAELLGWDHWTDLALIRIDMEEVTERGLSFSHARFGDSGELQPGETVFAVGTPNGLTRTVTRGIISNTQRFFAASNQIKGHETGYFSNWLQTDAAINPGNSGGPLVLENGRVIGINTRGYLGANNLGFAVPAHTAQYVLSQLLENKAIVRSYIGIVPAPLQDLEDFFDLEVNQGVLVDSVDVGSPAGEANFRPGDILLSLNGDPLDGRFPEQLPPILNRIALFPVGSELTFGIKRGGETITQTVVTEPLESRVGARAAFDEWGISVEEVTRAVARERKLDSDDGLRVIGLQNAFPGDLAGLRRGDILLRANRRTLHKLADFEAIHEAYEAEPKEVLLEVLRGLQVSYVVLKP